MAVSSSPASPSHHRPPSSYSSETVGVTALANLESRIASLGGMLDSYSSPSLSSSGPAGTPEATQAAAAATAATSLSSISAMQLPLEVQGEGEAPLSPSAFDRLPSPSTRGLGDPSGEYLDVATAGGGGEVEGSVGGGSERGVKGAGQRSLSSSSLSAFSGAASDLAREVELLLSRGRGGQGLHQEENSFEWRTDGRRSEREGGSIGGGGAWDELEEMAERLEVLAGSGDVV